MRRTQRPFMLVSGLLTFSLLWSPTAFAEGNPVTKFGRGVANAATGWIEIPKEFARYTSDRSDKRPAYSPIFGLFEGIQQAGRRTLFGFWDIVTFPFPPYSSPTPEPPTLIEPKKFNEWDDIRPEDPGNVFPGGSPPKKETPAVPREQTL